MILLGTFSFSIVYQHRADHPEAEYGSNGDAYDAERAPVLEQGAARDEKSCEHETGEDPVGDLLHSLEKRTKLWRVDANSEVVARHSLGNRVEPAGKRIHEVARVRRYLEHPPRREVPLCALVRDVGGV